MPNTLSQPYQAIELDSSIFIENLYGDHIEHYGIKNQKWYRRLFQYKDGSLTPLGRIHYGVGPAKGKSQNKVTSDENKESKNGRKNVEDMTDQEIQQYVQRLRNEAEIKRLTKEASKGSVRKFLDQNAKQGFNRAMNSAVEKTINKAVDKMLEDKKEVKYSALLSEKKAELGLAVLEKNDKNAATKLANLKNANSGKIEDYEKVETKAEGKRLKAQEKKEEKAAKAEAKKAAKEEKAAKRRETKEKINKILNKKSKPEPKHMKHSEEFLEEFIQTRADVMYSDSLESIGR